MPSIASLCSVARARPACFALLVLCALTALPAAVQSAAKPTIGLRGVARNLVGLPIADGTYGVTVSFYAAQTGGSALYADVSPGVKVVHGLFEMRVGAFKELDVSVLTSATAAWVGVSFAGEPELPRQPLDHVAYAVRALSAAALQCSGCVGKEQLAAGLLDDLVKSSALAKVATSGHWADVAGKPAMVQAGQCPAGQVLQGHTQDGKLVCVADNDTKYTGKAFGLSNQKCAKDQQVIGVDEAGKLLCATDQDTKYGGMHFTLSDQKCDAGKQATGVDSNGKLVCDAAQGYSGQDFALSGQDCGGGNFVQAIGADGKVKCLAESGKSGWGEEGTAAGNTSVGYKAFKELQSVNLPGAGRYLILANYRIRRNGSAHGFVKARLVYGGKTTEARMICEGIRPANSNFINYGGSVSWVIEVAAATKVSIQYESQYNNIYSWVNDSNGVPRPVAIRI